MSSSLSLSVQDNRCLQRTILDPGQEKLVLLHDLTLTAPAEGLEERGPAVRFLCRPSFSDRQATIFWNAELQIRRLPQSNRAQVERMKENFSHPESHAPGRLLTFGCRFVPRLGKQLG